MNTRFQKFLIFLFFLAASFSLLTSFAPRAQAQSTSLSISPPVVEILLAPNKQLKQTFNLQVGGERVTIIPSLHKLKPTGKHGHSEIDPSPLSLSSIPLSITSSPPLNQPYQINRDSFTLTLTLDSATLDVAEDVYLALVIRIAPLDQSELPLSSSTLPAISALIFTTINPTGVMPIGLEIDNFALPLIHDTWRSFTITPELKNTVAQMIRPEGKYEIIAPSGKVIFSHALYPNLILGNSARELSLKPTADNLPPLPLTFTPSWTQIGPHRIKLQITTQGGSTLTEVERVVWFLPLRLVIIIVFIILLSLAAIINGRRNTKQSQIDT